MNEQEEMNKDQEMNKEEVVKDEQPNPQTNEIKIDFGNIEVLKLQMLNRLVENTNKLIEILSSKDKKE